MSVMAMPIVSRDHGESCSCVVVAIVGAMIVIHCGRHAHRGHAHRDRHGSHGHDARAHRGSRRLHDDRGGRVRRGDRAGLQDRPD